MVRHPLELTIITLLTVFSTGATAVAAEPAPNAVDADVRSVARSNNEFAVALYEMLRNEGDAENLFFSPASISTALAMTYAGARTRTAAQFRETLRWTLEDDDLHAAMERFSATLSSADGGHALSLANALWGQSGEEFLDPRAKQVLWQNATLGDGNSTNYGLGWFSYVTSQDRWVVGHEGGGASWVIYYPHADLAVIALSNMSGARADSLPYEIARAAFAQGIFTD